MKICNVLGEFEECRVRARTLNGVTRNSGRVPLPLLVLVSTYSPRTLVLATSRLEKSRHSEPFQLVPWLGLNEDIYAGMTAFGRGGRIKHTEYTEYYQCGKGRDLGCGTILNFQTKIGTGMGEQMLSREYYYMGTQLPVDRFLTFYYDHPGFHINNMLIILSAQIFIVTSE